MSDSNIAEQGIASRKGMLMGMTLAEVMLIVLFTLLLLLGKSIMDLMEEQENNPCKPPLENCPSMGELTQEDVDGGLGPVIAAVSSLPPSERPPVWATLTSEAARSANPQPTLSPTDPEPSDGKSLAAQLEQCKEDNSVLEESLADCRFERDEATSRAAELEQELSETNKRMRELEKGLGDAQQRANELEDAVADIAAGSPPPCLHEPAPPPDLRGETISLGTVHIENGYLSLVAKNLGIPNANPVDYIGREVAYAEEADEILRGWPDGRRMTPEQFGQYGQEYLRIGDIESDDKLKCRFTMSYYIEDGVPYSMFIDVFLGYFYMQQRLNRDEFERIR